MPSIIINADDYALSPGVSAGIRQLLRINAINATSVMTNSSFWPKEAPLLLPFRQSADIGLHLCLTDLPALTTMPSLAPNGLLPNLSTLMKKSFLKQLPLAAIKKEFEAQLIAFIQRMQCYPSHLDGHQHIHCLPGVRQVVLDLYHEYFKTDHPETYIRNCWGGPWKSSGLKAWIIHALGYPLAKALEKQHIPHNQTFTGIYDFSKNKNQFYADHFKRFLAHIKEGGILMCHPGFCDTALEAQDSLTHQREEELRFFLSDAYFKLLEEAQVDLYQSPCALSRSV